MAETNGNVLNFNIAVHNLLTEHGINTIEYLKCIDKVNIYSIFPDINPDTEIQNSINITFD